jgi:hypothetical protein
MSLDMLLCNGLTALIRFGFDELRVSGDRASQTNAEVFAGFGFNIEAIPTRWGSHLLGNLFGQKFSVNSDR